MYAKRGLFCFYSSNTLLIFHRSFLRLFTHPYIRANMVYVLPALTISNSSFCIYVFHMIIRINIDYFLKQHQPVNLCNAEVLCFLCGTDSILK
jgi:uncharacterized protein with PQ loop repeat